MDIMDARAGLVRTNVLGGSPELRGQLGQKSVRARRLHSRAAARRSPSALPCEREGEPGCFTGWAARVGLKKQRFGRRKQYTAQGERLEAFETRNK
jgi:hypothetical protein